jgi:hypothetical protein
MGAGAPIGNKNAEVWTFDKSNELLDKATELTNETDFYIVGSGMNAMNLEGYKFDFIGELARELNIYRDLIPRDIPNRFPELRDKVNLIISRLESNCYSNTKKGLINTATGIINLKSNHKWTDRVANDLTSGGDKIAPPIEWISPKK